ncbi:MAG: HlyD family efflux transporter periplasmic adaptor subunit [Anaerolineae bacterium]|nr:MAG: HlyD family efflux transporter periplasmic adaptor subunit [Anaerolineae bacterium]
MAHKRPLIAVAVLLLAALAVVGWFAVQGLKTEDGSLSASGTIEATEVTLSPELGGRVAEVYVSEGEMVQTGDVLFRLDDTLLQAQREVALSALESARAAERTARSALETARLQYELTLDTARAQEGDARLKDWLVPAPDRFDQPSWYFTRAEQIAAAEAEVQVAKEAYEAAQAELEALIADLGGSEFLEAEKRLAEARLAYQVAYDLYSRSQRGGSSPPIDVSSLPPYMKTYSLRRLEYQTNTDNDDLIDAAREIFDDAKAELDAAQEAYDRLLGNQEAKDVQQARAKVSVAWERYLLALDRLRALRTGDYALQVSAAQKALEQAQATLEQAQTAVRQAEANLSLLDTQIEKLTVRAPMDGVVLTRNVEPGEVVQPGAEAIVLIRPESLTITVYIPEDRYGEIFIGQRATVSVDSFPGETFQAEVIYISDRAEFTPRNVQTVEGRSSTVYAVKLRLEDPQGRLKPGMPADVTFLP